MMYRILQVRGETMIPRDGRAQVDRYARITMKGDSCGVGATGVRPRI